MRSAAAQQRPVDDDKIAGAMSFPELQAAVEELTAVLRRLSAAPENMEEATTLAAMPCPLAAKRPRPGLLGSCGGCCRRSMPLGSRAIQLRFSSCNSFSASALSENDAPEPSRFSRVA